MRRLWCLLTLACLAAPAAAQAAPTLAGWDAGAQRHVARAGLLGPRHGAFHGAAPLTARALRGATAALAARLGTAPVRPAGHGTVTVAGLDRALVHQLGLGDVARHVQREAKGAGLHPPARFGTEVVARALGLRDNHADERLELDPGDPITRAEAAWSLDRIRRFAGWEVESVRTTFGAFALPRYTDAQRAALRVAVSRIGMPYVWGGETDGPSYGQVHGGYDCSGFAWRVFKLSGLPAGGSIGGRTAAQQAGEIPRSRRIPFKEVHPADLLFFGTAKLHSRATEASVTHEGIALSPAFMIHSSSQGVYVSSLLEPWRRAEFSWARRVL